MQALLHSIDNGRMAHIATGTAAEMRRKMNDMTAVDKSIKYALYTEGGILLSSTFSGGANPHDWRIKYSHRRKHSGLTASGPFRVNS